MSGVGTYLRGFINAMRGNYGLTRNLPVEEAVGSQLWAIFSFVMLSGKAACRLVRKQLLL